MVPAQSQFRINWAKRPGLRMRGEVDPQREEVTLCMCVCLCVCDWSSHRTNCTHTNPISIHESGDRQMCSCRKDRTGRQIAFWLWISWRPEISDRTEGSGGGRAGETAGECTRVGGGGRQRTWAGREVRGWRRRSGRKKLIFLMVALHCQGWNTWGRCGH